MNISSPQYSKSTRGLRQTERTLNNQDFKLVFIYPMLFEKSLSRNANLFRSFLSTAMLKEIFVSNALNMVNMASQIHPLIDETGRSVDALTTIGNATFSQDPDGGHAWDFARAEQERTQQRLEANKYTLQQKIHEKTAVIKKFLDADPNLKKMNPYLEMITMDNMVDVPVIVGTKFFTVDPEQVTFILLVAAAENKPLGGPSGYENFKYVINLIKKTKPENAWKLLNNLLPEKESTSERLVNWFQDFPGVKQLSRSTPVRTVGERVRRAISDATRFSIELIPLRVRQAFRSTRDVVGLMRTDIPRLDREADLGIDESISIVMAAKDNLDETELFFKFMYNPDMLKNQFGIDIGGSQISKDFIVPGDVETVFNELHQNFMKTIDHAATGVIDSFINIFYPLGADISETKIRNKVYVGLSQVIEDNLEELKKAFTTDMQKDPELADSKMKNLMKLCTGKVFSDFDLKMKQFVRSTSDLAIRNFKFDYDQLTQFNNLMSDEISAGTDSNRRRLVKTLQDFAPIITPVLGKVYNGFKEVVKNLINELAKGYNDYTSSNVAIIDNIRDNTSISQQMRERILDDPNKFINSYRGNLQVALTRYIDFIFLYTLQIALCSFAKKVEVSVETAKHDVLDMPNFTLVIPIEMVMAIANVIAAKGWKEFVKNDGSNRGFVRDLNQNYIKGIVKFLAKRIRVPNIIVVDNKRGEVFYKLMHQQAVQKSNLRTLETFVKLTEKEELSQQIPTQNYYNY